jgi:hypothetical protein
MLNHIQTIARFDFEETFSSEVPYLLITIRKPGTKFVRIPDGSDCVEQCRLMFHENNGYEFNSRGVIVPLGDRQAAKFVKFVLDNRDAASLLVVQSEYASREVMAIAISLRRWLKIPLTCGISYVDPDPSVMATVQHAIATLPIELEQRGDAY